MEIPLAMLSSIRGKFWAWFRSLSTPMKLGVIIASIVHFSVTILVLVNYQKIIEYIVTISDDIRESGAKGVLVFVFLISIVSFPPMVGFASLCVIIGIVYGFPGFPIIAITSSIMSTVSLCVFKYGFRNASEKIIESHEKLKLFVSVIKDPEVTFLQEIFMLTLMKLCPLPYSITNGGLGCVPHLSPLAFFIACVLCSPKYLVQIFMGIQLRKIGGIDKDTKKLPIDIAIFVITGLSFALVSVMLYKRLQKKLQERDENSNAAYVRLEETV